MAEDVFGFERPGAPPMLEAATVAATPTTSSARKRARRIKLSDVQSKPIGWWWRPRIARGKVHLVAGDPGAAKSYLSLALAAINSHHGGLTDDGLTDANAASSRTLIMQVEDGLEDTTKPRLEKLGADCSLIETFAMDEAFVLNAEGIEELELNLRELRPSLLIVDPVTFFIGGKVDMHRANEVRQPLSALGALADQYDCAVMLLTHMNKSQVKSLYRVLGSIDFTAVVRSAFMVGRVEDEAERGRALFHIKSNIGKLAEPVGFDVLDDGTDTGQFIWLPSTDLTLRDMDGGGKTGPKPVKARAAQAFLRTVLADGPRSSADVKRLADDEGITPATLKSAAEHLIIKKQVEGTRESMWELSALLGAQPAPSLILPLDVPENF